MPLTHRPRPLLRSRKTELDREAVHLLRALVHDICWGTPAGQWDEDGHVQPARDTEDTILNVPPDTFILSSYFQVLRMLRKFLFILLGLLQFHPDGRSKSCPGLCFWVILPDHVPYQSWKATEVGSRFPLLVTCLIYRRHSVIFLLNTCVQQCR